MIAVVQRVKRASVSVEEPPHHAAIEAGLLILLGVEEGDTETQAHWMAGKLAKLRIFRDDQGRMNHSVLDIGGEVLVVSQFTLAGDCSRGHRPSFVRAADPEVAETLYDQVVQHLRDDHDLPVGTGVFGGMMQVELVNDGPVTIILRSGDD